MSSRTATIPIRRTREGHGARSTLLTAAEVAERLQVSTGWVYAETRAHRLPHVRLGRYVRFRADAIEGWIAELEARAIAPR